MAEDPVGRTMAEIGRRYDEHRNAILERIREGKVSGSMSGIEYYPKAWGDLDMAIPYDASTVLTQLTWDGEKKTHDYSVIKHHVGTDTRIGDLESALRPFAEFARNMPAGIPDGTSATQGSPLARKQVTFGDFRRAFKVLFN